MELGYFSWTIYACIEAQDQEEKFIIFQQTILLLPIPGSPDTELILMISGMNLRTIYYI